MESALCVLYLILVLNFGIVWTDEFEYIVPNCPSGDAAVKECSHRHVKCPIGTLCTIVKFRDIQGLNSTPYHKNINLQGCCETSHCKETGLFSVSSPDRWWADWRWEDLENELERSREPWSLTQWYKTNVVIEFHNVSLELVGACPKPYSYQMMNFGEFALPQKFNIGGEPLIPCTKTSDCELNEFCGHVKNPSYCNRQGLKYDTVVEQFNNNCLDKSSNTGKSLMFCFKAPINKDVRIKTKKDGFGLVVCSNDSDCLSIFTDGSSFCENVGKSLLDINENGNVTGITKDGICVEKMENVVVRNETNNLNGDIDETISKITKKDATTTTTTITLIIILCVVGFVLISLGLISYFFWWKKRNNQKNKIAEGRAFVLSERK